MQNILESMMLLCFGFSWPISVVNNYRSRTTRGMSLPFILLIIFGYICGITAKLISHNITYVLAVYIFNLPGRQHEPARLLPQQEAGQRAQRDLP